MCGPLGRRRHPGHPDGAGAAAADDAEGAARVLDLGPVDGLDAARLELLAERPEIGDVVTGTVGLDGLDGAMADLADGRGGIKVLVDPRA